MQNVPHVTETNGTQIQGNKEVFLIWFDKKDN
jgi:hypothetical protein